MSSNGNGNGRGPIPFPQQNIPIVGQPFALKAFLPHVLIVCNCEAKEPLLLTGQMPVQCPACKKAYVIGNVDWDPQQNKLNVGIGLVRHDVPTPEPAGVPS